MVPSLLVLAGCGPRILTAEVEVWVPPLGVETDRDQDGVIDVDEDAIGTSPRDPDSDGDGLFDGEELLIGTDPTLVDSDLDGLSDSDEILAETDPLDPDSDGGGALDGDEILVGTDPADAGDDAAAVPGAFGGGGGCDHTNGPTGGLLALLVCVAFRRPWGRA